MTTAQLMEEFVREQGYTDAEICDAIAFARSAHPGSGDREIPDEDLADCRATIAVIFAIGLLKAKLGINEVQEIVERN